MQIPTSWRMAGHVHACSVITRGTSPLFWSWKAAPLTVLARLRAPAGSAQACPPLWRNEAEAESRSWLRTGPRHAPARVSGPRCACRTRRIRGGMRAARQHPGVAACRRTGLPGGAPALHALPKWRAGFRPATGPGARCLPVQPLPTRHPPACGFRRRLRASGPPDSRPARAGLSAPGRLLFGARRCVRASVLLTATAARTGPAT